jgi:UDPglucose 6-dehydrogenase
MPIVEAAIHLNTRQRLHIIEKLQNQLKVLRGTTIGLLGLAFKGNTDDLRDSPALTLIEHLHDRGAVIRVHDPITIDNARRLYPNLPVEYCETPECLAMGCDALVVVTDWPQYRQLPFDELRKRMRGKLILDARNLLNPQEVREAELEYVGVGH